MRRYGLPPLPLPKPPVVPNPPPRPPYKRPATPVRPQVPDPPARPPLKRPATPIGPNPGLRVPDPPARPPLKRPATPIRPNPGPRLAAVQHALVPPDSREERLAAWVAKQVRPFTVGEAIHGGLGLCPEPKEEPKLRLAVGKMLGRLRCTWARPRAEGGGRFTTWERPVVR